MVNEYIKRHSTSSQKNEKNYNKYLYIAARMAKIKKPFLPAPS